MAALFITPVVANPRRVTAGGAVVVSSEERNAAGTLTTAGTSTTIVIYGANGGTLQTSTAMTADATGKHSYTYTTVTSAVPGWCDVEITTVDGGVTSIERRAALFEVR